MASGTADLQRDLGGAIMQSIFGALLTAGYAAAAADGDRSVRTQHVTTSVAERSSRSRSRAPQAIAQQYPQYASQIIAGAKTSFLHGDHWAYTAGIIAVLLGAVIVFFLFPTHEREQELLAEYAADGAQAPPESAPTGAAQPSPA